ncbi:DUF551 domain-containing protein [Escherichia coli]|nr:DUF551 domain-containing protein [Escherichia coli]
MSEINYQALREAAEQAMHDDWGFDADLFHELVTPSIVLELLDERERNQQYIKRRDQENEDIALTVGKLRVERETAKSKLNEQREYYEGVIEDGGKRIAELEAKLVSQTYKLNEMSGNSPVIPDGWISCSARMPAQDDWILIYSKHGEYMAGQVQGEYVELSDGTLSWLGNALFWTPLPEPPQEVNRG